MNDSRTSNDWLARGLKQAKIYRVVQFPTPDQAKIVALADEVERLRAAHEPNALLEAAWRKYGRHAPECQRYGAHQCTCGFVETCFALTKRAGECQHDVTRSDNTIAHGEPPYCAECERIAQFVKWPAKADAAPVAWRRWLSSGKWFYFDAAEEPSGDDWQPLYATKADQ